MIAAYLIIAYLIGSIPFGLMITKCAGLGDIRNIGSGNIGATNVLRTGNKKLAAATLLLDLLKGAAATALAYTEPTHSPQFIALIGLVAILGHIFPVWLKFKGGKGVATSVGVLLAAVPWAGLAAIAVWLGMLYAMRIPSMAALTAAFIAPIVTFFIYGTQPAIIVLIIAAIVWWRHAENIKRLLNGTESKVSFRKPDAPKTP